MESIKLSDGSSQQYGYVVYETSVRKAGILTIEKARDFVYVSLYVCV